MAKRGQSGLSLLVGVDKPKGMTSHDVVNCCRRVFGERRVGHTGTLDPLASGVLPICVGPATRLDNYLTGHDKRYRATMRFGSETDTDDALGTVTRQAPVPGRFADPSFAEEQVRSLVGEHDQVPPRYSAVKLQGKKAYERARAGQDVQLPARRIRVLESSLVAVGACPETGLTTWEFDVKVSKGTYIRSLVRDLGRALECPAHLLELRRLSSGLVHLQDCVSLEELQRRGVEAALDPVRVLGLRCAFADDAARFVEAGAKLFPDQAKLFDPPHAQDFDCCTSSLAPSAAAPADGEIVCIVIANRLKALYRYDAAAALFRPECVFSTPIARR